MAMTTEKIVENFLRQIIQPIVGKPVHESASELHLKLNTNAASVHSNRGIGKLGLLFLTLKRVVHAKLSTMLFVSQTT